MKKNTMRNGSVYSLCWDCKLATDNRCPWVDKGDPVPGWDAVKVRVNRAWKPYGSYMVNDCPMFKRDAWNGGTEKYTGFWAKAEEANEGTGNSKFNTVAPVRGVAESAGDRRVDNGVRNVAGKTSRGSRDVVQRDVLDLAYGILERAVEDWQALQYGAKAEAMVDGEIVERKDILPFFFSEWFYELCEPLNYTPKQIREHLHIPDDALEIMLRADAGRRFLRHGK